MMEDVIVDWVSLRRSGTLRGQSSDNNPFSIDLVVLCICQQCDEEKEVILLRKHLCVCLGIMWN